MKNKLIMIAFLAIGLAGLQGCQKDDSPSLATIKGRWDMSTANLEYFENGVSKSKSSATYSKGEAYFIFTDTTFEVYTDDQLEDSGTYTYDSSTKILTFIYSPSDTESLQVKTLNNTMLVFAIDETETNNGITYRVNSEIVFKKG